MFLENIKKATEENNNFRNVLYTGNFSQLVLMCIPIGEEIGSEIHPKTDQIIVIVKGDAEAIIDNLAYDLTKNDAIYIPSGTKHNIINIGDEDLNLYTIYSPAEHSDGIIQKTKADAEQNVQ